MENNPIELPSGRFLETKMASFSVGTKLYKTIARELTTVKIELTSLNMQHILGTDLDAIKNAIFALIASDNVEAALFEVMKDSRINDERITRASFEAPETRGDYAICAWEVGKFNLLPFLPKALFASKTSLPTGSSDQK